MLFLKSNLKVQANTTVFTFYAWVTAVENVFEDNRIVQPNSILGPFSWKPTTMYFTLLLKLDIINVRKQLAHVQIPKQKVNPYPKDWWTKRKKPVNPPPHWRSNLFRIIPFISPLNPTLSRGGGTGEGEGVHWLPSFIRQHLTVIIFRLLLSWAL